MPVCPFLVGNLFSLVRCGGSALQKATLSKRLCAWHAWVSMWCHLIYHLIKDHLIVNLTMFPSPMNPTVPRSAIVAIERTFLRSVLVVLASMVDRLSVAVSVEARMTL